MPAPEAVGAVVGIAGARDSRSTMLTYKVLNSFYENHFVFKAHRALKSTEATVPLPMRSAAGCRRFAPDTAARR